MIFISIEIRQTNLIIRAPHRLILNSRLKAVWLLFKIKKVILYNPYPPNLSKIPAKIIEPLIGASTCAFGNHKWNPQEGSFTKNAINSAIFMMKKLKFVKFIDIKLKDKTFS